MKRGMDKLNLDGVSEEVQPVVDGSEQSIRYSYLELPRYLDLVAELKLSGQGGVLKEVFVDLRPGKLVDEDGGEYPFPGFVLLAQDEEGNNVCAEWVTSVAHLSDGASDSCSDRYRLKIGAVYSVVFAKINQVGADIINEGENEEVGCGELKLCVNEHSILVGSEKWINRWK